MDGKSPPSPGEHATSYRILPLSVDFDDPEGRFELSVKQGKAELSFVDWRARPVRLIFHNVRRTALFRTADYRGLPEGRLIELLDSPALRELLNSEQTVAAEELRHFVVSSNGGEWAEFVASHYQEGHEDAALP